jgi:3-hydroxybutyryl-CoA dehydrogenase
MTVAIHQIGVVGAGTMGSGIAQVFGQKGYGVLLFDVAPAQLQQALSSIDKSLSKDLEKGRIGAKQKELALQNVQTCPEISRLAKADLIVEAVSENFEVKKAVFKSLDAASSKETILASNTSSISITELAAATERPGKVIGMHFMNPVPLMKLVEIIRGIKTSSETVDSMMSLVQSIDKVAVEVSDAPGFVSNRVLMPMINEAIFCVHEGVGSAEAVDTVMKLGMNHPMGPLTLADLIGLDVCLDIMETLYNGFSDSKYRPCPLLRKMVAAGLLGRKSGQGFYEYSR